ncbi:hypothetical protein A4H97_09555 [Niastella yeongjuensis]|uniref:T9SS C-terminal target domain-containing protein n=1 Tax=Niastella yeongjuensis TaxID=354355 RepID=A0A1V9EF70_9BACT|nr:hypothetical protein [Niastella yeongjuensis]OQP44604.1 hypothetical protein A4H97_09555 [Niastella yeongjuensis]SEO81729.1 hypothetical protein SAMN05660816_03633 [Niastella yeongjuensis]
MKRLILSVAVIALAASACKKNADKNFNARGTQAGALALPEKTIPSIVSSDLVLSNDTLWLLDGKVYVNNGATLVIQEGARVEGIKKATNAESSALIVTRGSQLFAVGNPDQPIVFSAHVDANNPSLEPGDWGGIVLLGKATVNKTEPTIEGIDLPTIPAGVDVHYGGSDDADNSGNLQYVRIEYAGAAIATDNELNGLTCGGVGCGTVLDFIESAYGADDAFEFFGGTVNAKHLYALAPNDDAFDFDNGYRGSVQFAVSQLRAELSYSANPNGIECDNDATGSNDQPITKPQISNMTVIGLETATQAIPLWNAAYFRRNSKFNVKNSIFMGFPTGLNHESVNTDKNFSHNLITAFTTVVTPAGFPIVTGCGNAATDLIFTSGLNAPFASTPDYRPAAGSQAVTAGTDFSCFSGICEAGFIQSVSYRGAFDATNNWLAGWAKYDY